MATITSASPAWLSIALTTLASSVEDLPADIVQYGIRHLPSPHILHHLNRWAKHVWRPAVAPHALTSLTRTPTRDSFVSLGYGAASLLCALVSAMRRCDASAWRDVVAIMFLCDDPWTIEVGRESNIQERDIDRAIRTMPFLCDGHQMLNEAIAEISPIPPHEVNLDSEPVVASSYGDPFAELRCRIAAMQLQLDDITSTVRRNDRNVKDLLSSFHFWSLLLLDELRGYRAFCTESTGVSKSGLDGRSSTTSHTPFDCLVRRMGQMIGSSSSPPPPPTSVNSPATPSPPCLDVSRAPSRANATVTPVARSALPAASAAPAGVSKPVYVSPLQVVGACEHGGKMTPAHARPKRIFRDGKWIIL